MSSIKSLSILAILVILLSVQLSNAVVDNTSTDVGAYMVKQGLKITAYSIGDSIVNVGTGNQTVNREEVPSMIFKMLTFSIDPYQFNFVTEWQNVMVIFFVILTLLIIMLGAASVIINRTSPDVAYRISWMLDSTSFFDINKWLSTIAIAIGFLLMGTFGIYYILKLEYVVSAIITEKALLTAPPVLENIIVYLIFALVYLLLSIVMAIRTIVIMVMAAGALGLFALYLIPQTRNFSVSAFMYFLVVLFMQPILLFIAAVGLGFINMIPFELFQMKNIIMLGLTVLLIVVSLMCILGKGIVKHIVSLGLGALA